MLAAEFDASIVVASEVEVIAVASKFAAELDLQPSNPRELFSSEKALAVTIAKLPEALPP